MAIGSHKPCVVITRPTQQASQWASALAAVGIESCQLNLLEIVPVGTEEQVRAVKNKILDFDLYQKAIFVSQNAVEMGMQWLEDYWPQLPVGIDFFAVGATTAKKLSEYGVAVTDLATSDSGGMTSEDLLDAPGLQQVDGEKIIIFRGCGGRGHMGDVLRQRGAWVDYCEVYQRRLPPSAAAQWHQLAPQVQVNPARFILSVHSGESLENFLQLLQAPAAAVGVALNSLPVLVPSQRVAARAATAGFTQVICAENATDPAMTRALLEHLQHH